MKPLNQIISEKTDEALKGYALKGQVTFHDNDLPDGVTLSERFSIYLKENSFAIKQEIFDPDGYGQPSVTNLTKHLTSDQVVLEMRTYIHNDQREAKINNKPFTSLEQLNSLVETNFIHTLKPTVMEATPTSKPASKDKLTIEGNIGTKGISFVEKPKFRVTNLTLRTGKKGDANEYTRVSAYAEQGDILKSAYENEKMNWLKLEGKWVDQEPFTVKQPDNSLKTVQPPPKFQVSEVLERSGSIQVHGNIGAVYEKKTLIQEKPFTDVFVINNTKTGGVEGKEQFNISIFKESAKVGEGVELAKGKTIAVDGKITIKRRPNKTTGLIEDSTNITAYYVERTPALLKEKLESIKIAADKKKSGPEKESKSEAKDSTKEQKPKKAPAKSAKAKKDPGIEM